MNQQWISEGGTRVEGDAQYAPVNAESEPVGASRPFRRGDVFPSPPDDAIGWLQEDALRPADSSPS